ncbi:MAG: hypothetical protein VKN72_20035 [Nostocales cyanobacterium 94392]|nr:hypothetical protein [Nostocales cyanobacterium 94392]
MNRTWRVNECFPTLHSAPCCFNTHEDCVPPSGSDVALRFLRDRINVPRDMSH